MTEHHSITRGLVTPSMPSTTSPAITDTTRVPPIAKVTKADLQADHPAPEIPLIVLRQLVPQRAAPPSLMQLTISSYLNAQASEATILTSPNQEPEKQNNEIMGTTLLFIDNFGEH